ncbi:hypothetical protein GGG16DRAFT_99992 [Schizophyllum commune]
MGLSAQELHAQGLFVNRALDLVGMSLLLYDYAITIGECIFSAVLSGPDAASDARVHRLGSEIELLWHHVKRRRLYIFFAFRYSTLALVVATTALNFFDLPSLVTCRTINYIDSACVAAIQVAVSVAGIAVSAWAVANQDGDFDVRKAKNGSGMSCLVLYVPDSSVHWMSAVWIILMVFDLIVFALTAFKTMEAVREPKMALSRVLLRDACLYFGYAKIRLRLSSSVPKLISFRFMVLLNAANVVTYYVATVMSHTSALYARLTHARVSHTAVCRIECSPVLRDFEHAVVVGQSDASLEGHQRSGLGRMGPWRRDGTHVLEISRHETAIYSANGCTSEGASGPWPTGHPPPPLHSSSTSSLDPRLRERRTPPEMATGLEAQMKLAALAVQSVLFGIYIALVLAMIYLLTLRPQSETVRRTSRLGGRLLFAGLILLSAMITGEWICIVIRAFQAFILWEGGQHADSFYANITGPSEVLRSAFHSATVTIADLFVVARLYVIWNYKKSVIVIPITALVLLLVSAVGVTYAYGAYEMMDPATLASLHRWRMAQSILTIWCACFPLNVFASDWWSRSSAMIVYEVGRVQRQAAQFSGSRSVRSVVTLMAESAAFYTSIVLIAQITYGTNHVSNYFFNDCIPPAAALAAVLVHVRAVLGRGSGQEGDAEMTPVEGRRGSRGSSWAGRGSGWGGRDGRASTWDGRASTWDGRVERSPSTPTFGDRASGEERRSASTEGRRSTVKRCTGSPIQIHVTQSSHSCVDLRDVPKAVCR